MKVKSKAKMDNERSVRIKALFQKKKIFLKDFQKLAGFEEPIVILMRGNGRVEFFEKCKKEFVFDHTNGKEMTIYLNRNLLTFDYGRTEFKGYICHEDNPFPLPEDPVVTTELLKILTEKIILDKNDLDAKKKAMLGDMFLKIGLGIGAMLLAGAVAYMLAPEMFAGITKRCATEIVNNATTIANSTSGLVR